MQHSYILKRLGLMALTILCATFLTFVMLRLTPGDPADLILKKVFVGSEEYVGTQDERSVMEERYGLNQPLFVQYGRWLGQAATLDFGHSYTSGQRVSQELGLRVWPTLSLAFSAMAVSLAVTLLLGALYNLAPFRGVKTAINLSIVGSIAIPNFYLALLLVLMFSLRLDLLPVSGYGTLAHYILPVATLACTYFGYTTTILNDSATQVRSQEYILTARSKGLAPAPLFSRHMLRNSLVPVVPYAALQLGYMLGGVVVVETVFSWPGVGKYLVDSLQSKDMPVIQACIAFIALAFSGANLLADLVLWLMDPRVRFTRS